MGWLDVVSNWLIATRSGVTTVTIYACIIAGLFAWRDKSFFWLSWLVVMIGLFIAHGTNEHPLVQGFWTKPQQMHSVRGGGSGATCFFMRRRTNG